MNWKMVKDVKKTILNPGTDDEEIQIIGSYTFLGDDGVLYTV